VNTLRKTEPSGSVFFIGCIIGIAPERSKKPPVFDHSPVQKDASHRQR